MNGETPPKGKLRRGSIITKTAAKVGLNTAAYLAKRGFMNNGKKEAARSKLDEENAAVIFKNLSSLKGAPLKIAQMLSLQAPFLPERYITQFEQAVHSVTPLNKAVVRRQFLAEFGAPPEELFSEFSPDSFAAASLGQAHKARMANGDTVAVKIQYPGVDKAIESDIAVVRNIFRALPNQKIWSIYLDEVEERLKSEADYVQEADSIRWFEKNAAMDGVLFPTPVESRSTERILTMKFLDGQTVDRFIAQNPAQRERDRVAQRLWDINMRQLYGLFRLQADAHPGNYLINGSDIGMLDFGCVKRVPEDFAFHHLEMLKSIKSGDDEATLHHYGMLMEPGKGIAAHKNADWRDVALNFIKPLRAPLLANPFDFADNDYFQTVKTHAMDYFRLADFFKGGRHFIFIDRVVFGLPLLFHKMRAKVTLNIPERVGL